MADQRDVATLILRFIAQTEEMSAGIKRAQTEISGIESKVRSTTANIAKYFAGAFSVGVLISQLKRAGQASVEFGEAMAEVSTLLPKDTDLAPLRQGALESAKLYGAEPQKQAKAYYQIISAGFTDTAKAEEVLGAANQLAVGGLTDVFTAADGLTSVMNAYGDRVKSATDVTDAMFVAMKAGKTTINELSQNIGNVATIAAQTGVALDDLLAATAALTLGGVRTAEAMTQIRSVLVAVLKQEESAVTTAKQLGIEFSVAAIKAKGFAAWIKDVADKTGGSAEKLAELFGRVEGLSGVLSLGGSMAKSYAAILDDMSRKAGQTQEAFKKMSEDAAFKFRQLKAAFTVMAIEIGDKLLSVILPATNLLVKHFDSVVTALQALAIVAGTRLALALGTALVAAVGKAVVTLRSAYLSAVGLEVLFGRLTVSSSILGVALSRLALLGRAAWMAIGGPVGFALLGITGLTAAWVHFGKAAGDAGETAAGVFAKQKTELDKQILAHREIKQTSDERIKAIDSEISALRSQTAELKKQKESVVEVADGAEAAAAAFGDTGAVNAQKSLGEQIALNERKTRDLVAERENLSGATVRSAEETWIGYLEKEREILREQILDLSKRKAAITAGTPEAPEVSIGIALGDVTGAAETTASLEKALGEKEALWAGYNERLANLQEDARDKALRDTIKSVEEFRKIPPPGVLPPEVLSARFKAQQKIMEVETAFQLAVLDDSYQRGLVDMQEYYDRRRVLVETNTRREISALKVEAAAKSTKPERREEIIAEIKVKETRARVENIKTLRDEARTLRDFHETVRQGELEATVAENEERLRVMETTHDFGIESIRSYYSERRRVTAENTQIEIDELERKQEEAAGEPKRQQEIENQILAIRRNRRKEFSVIEEEESRDVETFNERRQESERAINQELISMRIERADNELSELEARHELEAESLNSRYEDQQKFYLEHTDELLLIHGEYLTKQQAIDKLAWERYKSLAAMKLRQAQEVQQFKLNTAVKLFGAWSQAMGAMFEASGGKIRAFFELQKAFSIAETTIKTYESAVKAYNAMVGIPYVGPALAMAAAAAAIAFGLAQVAMIAKSKPPQGMRAGGYIDEGSGTKDDVPILATRGEYMVKKQAVEFYGARTLEAINRMLFSRDVFFPVPAVSVRAPGTFFQEGGAVSPAASVGSGRVNEPLHLTIYLGDDLLYDKIHAGQRDGRLKLRLT